MKILIKIFIDLLILKLISASGGKYNISYDDLAECKEFNAVTGYGYHTYFEVADLKHARTNDELLHLRIYILSLKDAHILLTPIKNPNTTVPVYEIVLGAGANTFSEIRGLRRSKALKTTKRKGLLSAIDILPISIRITKSGLIEIKVVGETQPLLNTTDVKPIAVKYLSFSAWGTTEAKFFYDCAADDSDQLEKIVKEFSPFERLRAGLLNDYDVKLQPEKLTQINVRFELIRLWYNTKESYLTTRGILSLNWTDPKLKWDRNEYGNIDRLRAVSSMLWPTIWTPNLILINGKDTYFKTFNLEFIIQIHSNGFITATSKEMLFETWCSDNGNTKSWPSDELHCDILFGIQNPTIALYPAEIDFFTTKFNDFDQNEWHLVSTQLSEEIASKYTILDDEYLHKVDLAYRVNMKRNEVFYKTTFYTPLITSIIFILLSFWTTGCIRAFLNLLGFLITIMVFIVMTNYTPVTYVPTLVIYYEYALIMSWLIFMFFILNSWLEKCHIELEPGSVLSKVLRLSCIRLSLGLDASNTYNSLQQEDVKQLSWNHVGILIDRIAFLIFLILSLIILFYGI